MFPRRFRITYQAEARDCGLACLRMVADHFGLDVPRSYLAELCQIDQQGVSLASLVRAAQRLGFRASASRCTLESIAARRQYPIIVHLGGPHFVVVYRLTSKHVFVADPSLGKVKYTWKEFESAWCSGISDNGGTGIALYLSVNNAFEISATGHKKALAQGYTLAAFCRDNSVLFAPILLGTAASLAMQFALPILAATLVDGGLLRGDRDFVHLVLAAQFVFVTCRIAVESFQTMIVTYVGLRTEIRLASLFVAKLSRLRLMFFQNRTIGELLQRVSDHQKIQQFIVESLGTLLISCLSLVVFSSFLLFVRPTLFWIFLIGSAAYLLFCTSFFKTQRVLNHKSFGLLAKAHGILYDFFAGIQDVKLNNAERHKRSAWQDAQNAIFRTRMRGQFVAHLQMSGGVVLNESKNLLITLIAVHEVIAGSMSLGTMVAIQAIIGQLAWPLSQFASLLTRSHDAIISNERSREIHDYADEQQAGVSPSPESRADIVLRNVSFSYGGNRPDLVLRDVSLEFPYGTVTAIVGRSGSGKTTLLRLLLKINDPDHGEIMVGAARLRDLSHAEWRDACGVVMQDGYIFSDTIASNIAVGDAIPNPKRVEEAARIAQIDSLVESLPLKYETRIGREGIGISRGQSQRILIARALYRNPQYLFLDEPTSSLDANTEREVIDALSLAYRDRTAIVVAHRMSTVRNADQIVVVDGGAIVEVGTHDELLDRRSAYFDLVKDQLAYA